jgi:hypothetical protein
LNEAAKDQVNEAEVYTVYVRREDGSEAVANITGTLIDEDGSWKAFLTVDERVILYNENTKQHVEKTIEEARSLPRFPKLRDLLGENPPIDL